MGLDGVEMIMATEEEFQIVITEEESFHITTPENLCEVVYSKLRKNKNETCASQHGFYVARKVIIENTGIDRNLINPRTKLDEILPNKTKRKKKWKILLSEIAKGDKIWAPLERPKKLKQSIAMLAVLIVFPLSLYATSLNIGIAVWATIICSLLMVWLTAWAKTEFPKNFSSVGDLSKIVASLDPKIWKKEEVYQKLRTIISEQLSISEKKIHPNSNFVNDLGMD